MAVQIDIVYSGGLRCTARHGPSQAVLETDAPVDNHGRGESFSPTDLVATALGTCMLTIMGIVADRNGLDLVGTRVEVTKEMATQPVRRIAQLAVTIAVPPEKAAGLTAADRQKLENAALTCPVHQSLHPDVAKPVRFVW